MQNGYGHSEFISESVSYSSYTLLFLILAFTHLSIDKKPQIHRLIIGKLLYCFVLFFKHSHSEYSNNLNIRIRITKYLRITINDMRSTNYMKLVTGYYRLRTGDCRLPTFLYHNGAKYLLQLLNIRELSFKKCCFPSFIRIVKFHIICIKSFRIPILSGPVFHIFVISVFWIR